MRRHWLTLIAAASLGLGGPGWATAAEIESPSGSTDVTTAAAGGPAPTGGPAQETSSAADASHANDAAVDQSSVQGQAGAGGGAGTGAGGGPAHGGQEAHTTQDVGADAAASSNGAKNEAHNPHVGAAGDRGPVHQHSAAEADADSEAKHEQTQSGAPAAEASVEQSASASATAEADGSTNTLLDARIGAPGDDAGFDQSVHAGAAARADVEGPADAQQASKADAHAKVADARNDEVELRVESDGDSAGGRQSIAAEAEAAGGEATAAAVLENPFNTFVSLRVNSDGTTKPVAQDVSGRETETAAASTTERVAASDPSRNWQADSNGVAIDFTSNGSNTDLRIAVEDTELAQPAAPVFIWQWDLVFGPGMELDCTITSAADVERVTWTFDCDPEDRIERTPDPGPAAAPAPNTFSWAWSWLRPELAGWSWDRDDIVPLPTCGPTCTVILDFRWLSFEPDGPAVAEPAATETAVDAAAAVEQVNVVTASASASAESMIEQTLVQSGGDQTALQRASVVQLAAARAAAELVDARNASVGVEARASQVNEVSSRAEAALEARIEQALAQQQAGSSSDQSQAALQSASTSQQLDARAVATSVASSNAGVSVAGTAIQVTTSSAVATGDELAATSQHLEQEQAGVDSDQTQLAGQWADTVQQVELLAGAGLADARTSSTLNGDAATLRIRAAGTSTAGSTSAIEQSTLQIQDGDHAAQQQESFQIASVQQAGTVLAAATGGGTLRYVLVPAPAPNVEVTAPPTSAPVEEAPVAVAIQPSFLPIVFVAPPALRPTASPASAATAATPVQHPLSHPPAATDTAPPVLRFFDVSASNAGIAGPASKGGVDADRAPDRAPSDSCLTPITGGTAASAGTGSGSALAALLGVALTPVPRLGRRSFAPAGRRPAAVVLLRARPG